MMNLQTLILVFALAIGWLLGSDSATYPYRIESAVTGLSVGLAVVIVLSLLNGIRQNRRQIIADAERAERMKQQVMKQQIDAEKMRQNALKRKQARLMKDMGGDLANEKVEKGDDPVTNEVGDDEHKGQ